MNKIQGLGARMFGLLLAGYLTYAAPNRVGAGIIGTLTVSNDSNQEIIVSVNGYAEALNPKTEKTFTLHDLEHTTRLEAGPRNNTRLFPHTQVEDVGDTDWTFTNDAKTGALKEEYLTTKAPEHRG